MKKFLVKYLLKLDGFNDKRTETIDGESRESVCKSLRNTLGDDLQILACYQIG